MPSTSRLAAAALGAAGVAALPVSVLASTSVVRPRYNALLTHVAATGSVDARLIRAVAWAESGWRQEAVSSTGAVGIMQIEPSTGQWVSETLAGRRLDIWRAIDNVTAGSLLLRHLL